MFAGLRRGTKSLTRPQAEGQGSDTRGAITNAGSWMYTSGTMPLTNWAHPENSTIEMLIKRLKLHTLLSFLVSMYENFEYSKNK